ncbi:MAG: hypothetical protein RJA36_848 [Pseudomonadota bacterium]|jgi:hypothetical protein
MAATTLRQRLDRRFVSLKSERSEWEHEWDLIKRYVTPRRGRRTPTEKTVGRHLHRHIINSTASKAVRDLASGLSTAVVNPATPWFRLAPEDSDLEEFGGVRQWLDAVERRVGQILTSGGFYSAVTTAFYELAAFGTAVLAEESSFETVRRWHTFTAGEYYLGNGADGRATTCYRAWEMTVETMVAMFGLDRCSRPVQEAWRNDNLDHKFEVRHAVEPMSDRFSRQPGMQRWKYASVYWQPGNEEPDKFLRLGGNSYCPVHAVRWAHVPPDPYGDGPLAHALGDVMGLQSVERDMTVGARHKMNPAIQGPASAGAAGVIDPTRIEPGQFYPARGADSYGPIIDPNSFRLDDGIAYMQMLETRIQRMMFVDLFLMFAENQRAQPITATEVMERAREKQLIGPVLHNINNELLQPVISSVVSTIFEESVDFWARGEAGMVPPPPEEIQDADLKLEFIGELQQALRLSKAEPVYRVMGLAAEFSAIDPTLPMKIDFQQGIDVAARAWGVPAGVVRDDETVAAMMQEQAQQQAAAQAQQQQLADAETVAKLGKVSTEPGTLVGDAAAMAGAA